jgi:hypothetical protein
MIPRWHAVSGPYEAVNADQLRARLGRQCSPMRGKDGYIIGPDIHGRICHCSTLDTLGQAHRKANFLNMYGTDVI